MNRSEFTKRLDELVGTPPPLRRPPTAKPRRWLGDRVHDALDAVGISEERVSRWLGRPCVCPERRERLNRLHRWASRVISGKTEDAERHLSEMIEE